MAATIHQSEGVPATYPDPPAGLSTEAAALDADMLWQRIESWIAYRYSERTIVWIVEGAGDWQPPLAPATIATVERWTGTAWEVTTDLLASPLGGYQLPGCGPYRFTGTVGVDGAEVPAAVLEAFRRLAEYSPLDLNHVRGARNHTITIPDVISETVERSPAWIAMAMQNSGAADLLRPYRRA
jgi:hypothetical protein